MRSLLLHLSILAVVGAAVWRQPWPTWARLAATIVAIGLDLLIVAYRRRHFWRQNTRLEAELKARQTADRPSQPPPNGRFKVAEVFVIRARSLFCLPGEIVEGAVGRGQYVVEPQGIDAPVAGFDFLTRAERRDDVALTFRYHDEGQLKRWQALQLVGRTLVLRGDRSSVRDG